MPFPLENMFLFCASDRGLMDFFFLICYFPLLKKSELLKTNKNISLKMFFVFVDSHQNFYCCGN